MTPSPTHTWHARKPRAWSRCQAPVGLWLYSCGDLYGWFERGRIVIVVQYVSDCQQCVSGKWQNRLTF